MQTTILVQVASKYLIFDIQKHLPQNRKTVEGTILLLC